MKHEPCFRSARISALCAVCNQRPNGPIHLPNDQPDWFCGAHCPICEPVSLSPTPMIETNGVSR